jgi:hypothetical protein
LSQLRLIIILDLFIICEGFLLRVSRFRPYPAWLSFLSDDRRTFFGVVCCLPPEGRRDSNLHLTLSNRDRHHVYILFGFAVRVNIKSLRPLDFTVPIRRVIGRNVKDDDSLRRQTTLPLDIHSTSFLLRPVRE